MLLTTQVSKTVDRNSLFYGQFCYQCKFYVRNASALRTLKHKAIDDVVRYRNSWTRNRINDEQAKILHEVCDQLLAIKNPFKTMISSNWIYFYTNDLLDIQQLRSGAIGEIQWNEITQANVTHSKNEIGLQNPRHKFRTYVRCHKPTPEVIQSVKSFISAAGEDLRISPGLKEFLNAPRGRTWIQDGYFFDHNEMSMVTALALISPKLIRKTMPIVKINS